MIRPKPKPSAAKPRGIAVGVTALLLVGAQAGLQGLAVPAFASGRSVIRELDPLMLERFAIPPEPATEAETAATAPAHGPTHVLNGARATALDPAGTLVADELTLYARDGKWLIRSPAPVQVNGQNWHIGQALACGDELATHDGLRLTLIEVLPSGS